MKSICLVSGSSPEFIGGVTLYQKNLIDYAKKNNKNLEFTWVFPGNKNKKYSVDGIKCVEFKSCKFPFIKELSFSKPSRKFLEENKFDIINTHANWGNCLKKYKKRKNQKIIHTYHGTTYPYMKIQLKRFKFLKRIIFSPLLLLAYELEKFPLKKADEIICVSNKVKEELKKTYKTNRSFEVIRTGVDVGKFKKLNKKNSRKNIGLNEKKIYGLYSGRGGYWNKGLDRAVEISKEIYKRNKNYSLLVIGSDQEKCKNYLDFPFVEYKGVIDRKELPRYYSSADFFFSLSRYEGGAPTLALSEAISSECFTICSKDSKPEILENEKDCLIVDSFEDKTAKKILQYLEKKSFLEKMKKSAKQKINNLTLEKWGEKYLEVLLR